MQFKLHNRPYSLCFIIDNNQSAYTLWDKLGSPISIGKCWICTGCEMYFFQPFDLIFGPLREPTSLDVRDNDAHLERFVNLSPHIYLWDLWQIWGMLYVLCLMMFIWKDLSATSGALYATMRYSDPKYNWKQLTQQTNKKQTNKHTHTTNKQTHKQQAIITYQSISTSLSIIQSCQVQSISTVLLRDTLDYLGIFPKWRSPPPLLGTPY